MELRTISPSELDTWTKLCGNVFGGGSTYFYNHFINDPEADCGGIFVALDGGKLVSSVRVFTRRIFIGGDETGMGGIGEVCTLPEYRGKGINTHLLEMAVVYMRRNRLETSLLFTGSNHHYARTGWFTVPRRRVTIDIKAKPADGYDFIDTFSLPVSSAVRFYNENAVRYNGPVVRSEEYYRRWILKDGDTHRALVRSGEIAACAVYNISEKVLNLSEYTGDRSLLPVLLSSAAAENTAERASVSAVYAPENTDYSEGFSLMARLNLPFTAGNKTITSSGELAAALSDCVFFDMDGF